MVDEDRLRELSAYADGELDAAARARVEAALASDAGLRQVLAEYRRLDAGAAALPVPELKADVADAVWAAITERASGRETGVKPVTAAGWERVAANLPPVPQIPPERWDKIWAGIRARTVDVQAGHPAAGVVVRAPGSFSWWRSLPVWRSAVTLAAALVLLTVTLFVFRRNQRQTPPGHTVAASEPQPPEVLDERYFMMVKHVPGIQAPVVCFFLKDPEAELDETWGGAGLD